MNLMIYLLTYLLNLKIIDRSMVSKILAFVKTHFNVIALASVAALMILLSFAIGYSIAKYQDRTEVQIQQAK